MVFVPGIKHKESCSISCTHHADRLLLKLWYRSFPCLLQDKLAYFRIKELKDILNQLGLPKQGKKQVSECFPFLFPVFFPTLRFTSLYMYDFYWWIHGIQSSGVACCLVINRCGACMLCTTHFGCNYGFAERTWIQYCYFRTSYLPYLPQLCFFMVSNPFCKLLITGPSWQSIGTIIRWGRCACLFCICLYIFDSLP